MKPVPKTRISLLLAALIVSTALGCVDIQPNNDLVISSASDVLLLAPANDSSLVEGSAINFRWDAGPNLGSLEDWMIVVADAPLQGDSRSQRIMNPEVVSWAWNPTIGNSIEPVIQEGEVSISFAAGRAMDVDETGALQPVNRTPLLEIGQTYYWAVWSLDSLNRIARSSPQYSFVVVSP